MTRGQNYLFIATSVVCVLNTVACLQLFKEVEQLRQGVPAAIHSTVENGFEKGVIHLYGPQPTSNNDVAAEATVAIMPLVYAREPERSIQQGLNWLTPLRDMLQERPEAETRLSAVD